MDISLDTVVIVISQCGTLYAAVTANKTDIAWLKDAVKELKEKIN
ncbi:hypothetical protein [Pseudoalteromonas luteoviolacea]|uniref:Uncharacterized protein n=1 Tax=Pseudoalteromonas luteoviolacea NCIMB 1942 TaxID=1365253 RepID=A0A167AYZ9_9GAMM|nr:hypothetical protein [Pseudoalteromonas luteoviolacea]KZN45965.1 hypothetical protein N482_13045 [Pseudoalteromonas luteoviolacea NCIMB 1942]